MTDRVVITEEAFDAALASLPTPRRRLAPDDPIQSGVGLTAHAAVELFRLMVTSRALDVAARELKTRGAGYYTISSAGHEHNVVVGDLLRPTDPCFLHYRSGALMLARLRHDPTRDAVVDIVRSFSAAAEDPVAQGRHKVWGSRATWVPPQTSTIASHVPKAVGTAFAIGRAEHGAARPAPLRELPEDAIAMCSFGDASLNHASTLAGLNAARYARRRGRSMPILFVCEDNGLGISVDTPRGWVEATAAGLQGITYVRAAGDLGACWDAAREAIERCRKARTPVFLHLDTVRLWGHAGSDVEIGYRERAAIEADEARDPLPLAARWLAATGAAMPPRLRQIVSEERARVQAAAAAHGGAPPLRRLAEIVAPLAPYDAAATRADACGERGAELVEEAVRVERLGSLPEQASQPGKRTLGAHLNAALADEMLRRDEIVVFGEDVARKGGVYGVTAGLLARFGSSRVFDTLLDETTILGTAQGFGLLGYLPVPEIQYLAYVHNALDQIRGEACSTSFFSAGQFTNPMVVRIASFAYQRGFGGHFHNDDSIGALRDIPGLLIAAPARGDDAARMLRGCIATARVNGRVVAFLEPIAAYHERDLLAPGDGGWLTDYPAPPAVLLPGTVGVYPAGLRVPAGRAPDVIDGPAPESIRDAADVLIVTYANGVRMALQAARRLAARDVRARVLDLRWLNPLPWPALVAHASSVGRVLVADECRATAGGIADAVVAGLVERDFHGRVGSVRSQDTYVPLGPAAEAVLLSVSDIVEAVARLTRR